MYEKVFHQSIRPPLTAALLALIAPIARVRNPYIYGSDIQEEGGRKVVLFSEPKESQLRMLDTLANQVHWRTPDGYLRFSYKLFKAPRPRNSREVTRLRLALESMLHRESESATT